MTITYAEVDACRCPDPRRDEHLASVGIAPE
ncbi:hypothetical protein ABIB85_004397 [Bradyrhizobium sp. JR1.5]